MGSERGTQLQSQEALFKGTYDMFGALLTDDSKKAILGFLNRPTQAKWLKIRSMIICGHVTLWQAWCSEDQDAPRSGDQGFPAAAALRNAIRAAAARRRAELEEKVQAPAAGGLSLVK